MKKELIRQAIHYYSGNAIILLIVLFGTQFALQISVIALIIGFILSKQLVKKAKHPLKEVIQLVERQEESDFPGKAAFTLFAGIAITLFLFNNEIIALAAIIALTYGDSAATIIGKKFGRIKILGERSLEGSIAAMIVNFFYIALFINVSTAIIAAIIAALAEYLPIDDNISIPLVTATVLSFII